MPLDSPTSTVSHYLLGPDDHCFISAVPSSPLSFDDEQAALYTDELELVDRAWIISEWWPSYSTKNTLLRYIPLRRFTHDTSRFGFHPTDELSLMSPQIERSFVVNEYRICARADHFVDSFPAHSFLPLDWSERYVYEVVDTCLLGDEEVPCLFTIYVYRRDEQLSYSEVTNAVIGHGIPDRYYYRQTGNYSIASFNSLLETSAMWYNIYRSKVLLFHGSGGMIKPMTNVLENAILDELRQPYTEDKWLIGDVDNLADSFVRWIARIPPINAYWTVDKTRRLYRFWLESVELRWRIWQIKVDERRKWKEINCSICRQAPHMHASVCIPKQQVEERMFRPYPDPLVLPIGSEHSVLEWSSSVVCEVRFIIDCTSSTFIIPFTQRPYYLFPTSFDDDEYFQLYDHFAAF
ncbi:hypothetical protein K435DRAFT_809837 [Dendrothele bispora CBS 962.96]|uniref:Uncharacterized protein n=1 Tax=Dendrothele bispora (strain CBS 962.96) TaxID=1314807 RepID=A0A4S8KXB7_DENBC|nr:hypothetical protein K435DRAFT_809837 [Dendrothele bispora CBS 962.96]